MQFEILNKSRYRLFIVASEEMPSIDFYSGSKKKKLKGGVQFEILNKSRYRLFIVASEEMPSIDFYSGSKKKKLKGGCNSKS